MDSSVGSQWAPALHGEALQLLMAALSLLGVWAGHLAFKYGAGLASGRKRAGVLYWLSLSPSAIWYLMPFLPQSRLPSVADWDISQPWAGLQPLAGLAMAVLAGAMALHVVRINQGATGERMRDFLEPEHLLREGWYGHMRHPMFLCDFLAHWGLALALGARHTLLLLPLYFIASASFNEAEERYVLAPRFGAEFIQYRREVNAFLTPVTGLALAALAVLTLLQLLPQH